MPSFINKLTASRGIQEGSLTNGYLALGKLSLQFNNTLNTVTVLKLKSSSASSSLAGTALGSMYTAQGGVQQSYL